MDDFSINNPSEIRKRSLAELQRASQVVLQKLPEALTNAWHDQHHNALRRADRRNILRLLMEFQHVFAFGPVLRYELAFAEGWTKAGGDVEPLYKARSWICEYNAGVYFVYDKDETLRYIGSACGGALGNRIYSKWHHEYRHVTDVVLFGREWCHFALSFEALAISRLKPPQNGSGRQLWISPQPPFDRIWHLPDMPPPESTRAESEGPKTDGIG